MHPGILTNNGMIIDGKGSAADTTRTEVLPAQSGDVKNYVTSIFVVNSSSTNGYVIIEDGTTEKLRIPAPANSGAVINLSTPLKGSSGTAINFTSSASLATIYVSMIGFTAL
jgi:hypothetical protein